MKANFGLVLGLVVCTTSPIFSGHNDLIKTLKAHANTSAQTIDTWLNEDFALLKKAKSHKSRSSSCKRVSTTLPTTEEVATESYHAERILEKALLRKFVTDIASWLYDVKDHCLERHKQPALDSKCGFCYFVYNRYLNEALIHLETRPLLIENLNTMGNNIDVVCKNLLKTLYSK